MNCFMKENLNVILAVIYIYLDISIYIYLDR